MNRTSFSAGLLDFEYCASLHIEHPQLNPDIISDSLRMTPQRSHRAGDARHSPTGKSLQGNYTTGYWSTDLVIRDGEDVPHFLARIANDLTPAEDLLRTIVDDGGTAECFVGLFATGLCDQVYPSSLLLRFGQLGIDLRLDYYSHDERPPD